MDKRVQEAIENIETGLMYGVDGTLQGVNREDVARLLCWAKTQMPVDLVIGDTVEVIEDSTDSVGDSPYRGRKGTLVNIEARAKDYPYSVQFTSSRGGKSILYFNRDELKKVV